MGGVRGVIEVLSQLCLAGTPSGATVFAAVAGTAATLYSPLRWYTHSSSGSPGDGSSSSAVCCVLHLPLLSPGAVDSILEDIDRVAAGVTREHLTAIGIIGDVPGRLQWYLDAVEARMRDGSTPASVPLAQTAFQTTLRTWHAHLLSTGLGVVDCIRLLCAAVHSCVRGRGVADAVVPGTADAGAVGAIINADLVHRGVLAGALLHLVAWIWCITGLRCLFVLLLHSFTLQQ